jgi:thiol peroxidase
MTVERQGAITLRGNPFTLVGPEVRVGDKAPDFVAVKGDLSPFQFSETSGKVRIISSVPSLDTPVCDAQTRRFNEEVTNLPGVEVYTLSMDLPFAQKRWCGAADANHIVTLSDYREASFGQAYGTLIKELRLDARAVFVVDANDVVQHAEYVGEIASHPNYEAALEAAKKAAGL